MLEEIKKVLPDGNNSVTMSLEQYQFLLKEAEKLEKIRIEAEDLYDEKIDLMDFGERVDNIL